MKKTLIGLGVVVVVLVAGFYALNAYIYHEKQAKGDAPNIAGYFMERITTLGVEDIGQPIEGFDADLLVMAFPGLAPSDFSGVETLEGHYEVEGGEITHVHGKFQSRSSAERTVSEEGYSTLLENISARLSFPTMDEAAVDALIEKINTSERIETRLDQGASALAVKVIPHEVLEDSRCPTDVQCIQAGTVRVRATLESGLGTADQVFELDQPITTEAEVVTLIRVAPEPVSTVTIEPNTYTFTFEIKKR